MAVLYQKYRPQKFADIIGQSHIVRTLRNAADGQNLAHAYLLTGSRGVGKTTIARLLAKAANCPNLKEGEVCAKCTVCQAVEQGNFLDLIEIDAASNTGVDNVRELIEHVQFKPSYGAKKVFIIDEVHMLSKQAFNALLKTLEEPPEHAMFVLATTDIEKVPETIISRVQRFDFHRIDRPEMHLHLKALAKKENLKIDDTVINLIVGNAEGGLRDALSLLEKLKAYSSEINLSDAQKLLGVTSAETVIEFLEIIFNKQAGRLREFFEEQTLQGTDFALFNKQVLITLREVLYCKLTSELPQAKSASAPLNDRIVQLAQSLEAGKIILTTKLFLRAFQEQAYAPSSDLPLLLASAELFGSASAGTSNIAQRQSSSAAANADNKPSKSLNTKQQTSASQIEIQQVNTSLVTNLNAPKTAKENNIDLKQLLSDTGEANQDEPALESSAEITAEQAKLWWPDVVSSVKETNSPLATLLRNCPIQDVVGGKIILEVKYLFHKENIENKKNTALILEAINKVSGLSLSFKAVIVKDDKQMQLSETIDAISDAVKIFGGELVE